MSCNRREFLATSGAAMGVLSLPSLPVALPAPLKLYSVCDADYDPYYVGVGWCDAVWARSEDQALTWARDNYGGELWWDHNGPMEPEIRVLSTWDGDGTAATGEGSRETRLSVLREAGWMEESDSQCERCELYEFGSMWPVCEHCWCCPDCRTDCDHCCIG